MAQYLTYIPPSSVQAVEAFDAFANGAHTQTLAFGSNVTQGNLIYAYIYGSYSPIINGNPSGDSLSFVSISDTQTNVWTQVGIFTETLSFGSGASRNDTVVFFGIFFAYANATGADSVKASWTAVGGDTKSIRINQIEYKNVGSFVGHNEAFSSTNPATQPSLASTVQNQLYIVADAFGWATGAPSFTGVWSGLSFTSDLASGSPSVGPVAHAVQGVPGVDPTLSFGATNPNVAPYWGSTLGFNTKPATAQTNGNGFFEDYPKMTWMKNVTLLARDYWDQGLSSPYVGQIYPSPNTGGAKSGQTYPY